MAKTTPSMTYEPVLPPPMPTIPAEGIMFIEDGILFTLKPDNTLWAYQKQVGIYNPKTDKITPVEV